MSNNSITQEITPMQPANEPGLKLKNDLQSIYESLWDAEPPNNSSKPNNSSSVPHFMYLQPWTLKTDNLHCFISSSTPNYLKRSYSQEKTNTENKKKRSNTSYKSQKQFRTTGSLKTIFSTPEHSNPTFTTHYNFFKKKRVNLSKKNTSKSSIQTVPNTPNQKQTKLTNLVRINNKSIEIPTLKKQIQIQNKPKTNLKQLLDRNNEKKMQTISRNFFGYCESQKKKDNLSWTLHRKEVSEYNIKHLKQNLNQIQKSHKNRNKKKPTIRSLTKHRNWRLTTTGKVELDKKSQKNFLTNKRTHKYN